jgi:hypothetical protein
MPGILVAAAAFELRRGLRVWISSATNGELKFPHRQIKIPSRSAAWIQRCSWENEMGEADKSQKDFGRHFGGTEAAASQESSPFMKVNIRKGIEEANQTICRQYRQKKPTFDEQRD